MLHHSEGGRRRGRRRARLAPYLVALAALPLAFDPGSAQGLPTLSDLGLGYTSPGGAVQLGFSGRFDLEGYVPGDEPAWLLTGTEPFATGRLRLFGDLFLGDRWYLTAELRVDGGEAPTAGHAEARLEQAFLRWAASPAFAVQVGKFVSPFGGYPSRHHTAADPLIRPPLMYEYRTMVCTTVIPANSAAFVAWKDEPERFRRLGAPPVWGAPYQWGILAAGGVRAFSYRVAVVNSAPSSEPEEWAWDAGRLPANASFVAGVGYRITPAVRLELSYNRGPYLQEGAEGPLGAYAGLTDYDQVLWGAELIVERGRTAARLEAMHDRWEVPNVEHDPIDLSYSVEARQRIGAGLFAAARVGAIHFNRLPFRSAAYQGGPADGEDVWDYTARRLQLGGGYRIARNLEARAEYAWNRTAGPIDPRDDLFSLQLWWEF